MTRRAESSVAVMDDGLVIGIAAGTKTITATSGGKLRSVSLVVTAASGVNVCSLINGASVHEWSGRGYTVFPRTLTNRFDS